MSAALLDVNVLIALLDQAQARINRNRSALPELLRTQLRLPAAGDGLCGLRAACPLGADAAGGEPATTAPAALAAAHAPPLPAAANVVANPGQSMEDVVASRVSVRDLKTHLSQWLARAQAGEVVEVTSHRRPIARITAVKPADPISIHPLQNAIDTGLIRWNGQKPLLPPPVRLNDGGPLMSDLVIEDRG